jgi:peptidoglycan/xylan/chitin deacetylase (PgdA/CDA1 family)
VKAVLAYHSIDSSGSPVSVPESSFRRHVEWMASSSVPVVSLPELLATAEHESAVAITFDDGLESFGKIGAPLIREAELPVTVFIVPGFVGKTSRWRGVGGKVPELPLMDWDELNGLSEIGVELGAHSMTHAVLTELDDESLDRELSDCADRIAAETGSVPRSFAYPYGAHDARVVQATTRRFEVAVTAELDTVDTDTKAHTIPRLDMWYYRDPRRLEAWGSPAFHAHLAVRKVARRARRRLSGSAP